MFSFIKSKKQPKSVKELLSKIEELESKVKTISEELTRREKESKNFFQKSGLKRYNPFNELGGDQSFSIALLDSFDNGFVITSIFNKNNSRIFSKPIIRGRSEYLLSDEEKEAIKIAREKYGEKK